MSLNYPSSRRDATHQYDLAGPLSILFSNLIYYHGTILQKYTNNIIFPIIDWHKRIKSLLYFIFILQWTVNGESTVIGLDVPNHVNYKCVIEALLQDLNLEVRNVPDLMQPHGFVIEHNAAQVICLHFYCCSE